MTLKQVCPSLAINITGNYTDLQVGSITDITCQTDFTDITLIFVL